MIGKSFKNYFSSILRSIFSVRSISLRLERVLLIAFSELDLLTNFLFRAELGSYLISFTILQICFKLLELTSTFSPSFGIFFNY